MLLQLQEVGLCFRVSREKDIVEQILRLQGSNKKLRLNLNLLIDTHTALKEALSDINFVVTRQL